MDIEVKPPDDRMGWGDLSARPGAGLTTMGSGFLPAILGVSAFRSNRWTRELVGGMGVSSVGLSGETAPWRSDSCLGFGGAAGLLADLGPGLDCSALWVTLPAFSGGGFAREAANVAAWNEGDFDRWSSIGGRRSGALCIGLFVDTSLLMLRMLPPVDEGTSGGAGDLRGSYCLPGDVPTFAAAIIAPLAVLWVL